VVGKNAELEKQRAQGKYQKSFETDILKLRADELNFTLCMFVKEVQYLWRPYPSRYRFLVSREGRYRVSKSGVP
jgi:hypothetical protein